MTNEDKLRDYLKRVTTDLHQTRERLRNLEKWRLEPMAVVGMGCRFPGGVASPEDFWTLLETGTDAVTAFPADRGPEWATVIEGDPAGVGKSYAREGAFLHEAGQFDAQFFGISPREALAMDPQQRLLLETSWEALEDAGIDPMSLQRTATGVFAGLIYHDYAAGGVGEVEGYVSTGISGGVASGRVAYTLGLEGPAVTVDTACSSSLVAIHLAAQALRSGECTLALAGGVTVMARPGTFVEFSRQRGLAADGRCKAYAEAADGTGWGEGVGVLVLEKLSDAQRNGHRILAVVRGTAVNQDGASNGLTAPHGPSQQRVIRSALAAAGLSAGEVDVIEGHGTGTRLGDPIEADALLATYGQDRDAASPVLLGSVKSNIGHTQAAAGVAGVIKMIQAMEHGVVPATLHVDEPSSHIDWASGAVALVTEATAWPETDGRPRRAGVSSFGFSGTNAHVILEQAPEIPEAPSDAETRPVPVVPWLISARDEVALAAQAQRLRAFVLAQPELNPVDVGWSLVSSRSALSQRAVAVGADRDELLAGLEGVKAAGSLGKVGFVFTGQGSQRLGMGRQLYAAYPAFAEAFDAVCAGLEAHLVHSVSAVIDGAESLDDTMWAQAGLFAVEVALFRLLESWGVAPAVVAGHSIGELAAAHVAGVWSLPDACAVVAARGRLMQALPSGGAMLAVQAGEDEVRQVLSEYEGVDIAAVNGPTAVVVSGPADVVSAVRERFEARDVRVRNLRVSHAFHSSLMEPMLAEYAKVTASISYQSPQIALVSTVTGLPVTDELQDPEYWVRQVREPVRFADAVSTLRESGVRTFVELGPDAVLTALGATSDAAMVEEAWLPAMRRDRDEALTLVSAVGQVHARGGAVDWTSFYAGTGAKRVDLPTYAFTRERYWLNPASGSTDVSGLGQSAAGHALLGATVSLAAGGGLILTGRLAVSTQPWLADHVVGGRVIVPGAALVEMAIRAGDELGTARLAELIMEAPLVLPTAGGVRIQVVLDAPDGGRGDVAIYSQPEHDDVADTWTRHAVGALEPVDHEPATASSASFSTWPPADAVTQDIDGFYPALATSGLAYGPAFQGVRALWRRGDEVFAEVALGGDGVEVTDFGLHPALLDACLHGISLSRAESGPMVPFAWSDVVIHATGASTARVRIAPTAAGDGVAVTLADEAGELIASVGSVALRALPATALDDEHATLVREALFELDWVPLASNADETSESSWAVIGPKVLSSQPDTVHYADLAALLAAIDAGSAPVPDTAVVYCSPATISTGTVPETARALAIDTLGVIQEWLAARPLTDARLLVVTERAVDIGPGLELRASSVAGLVRAAAAENPGRLVHADVDDLSADPAELTARLRAGLASGEPEFALRQGQVLVPRLVRPGDTSLTVPSGLADDQTWRLDFTGRGTLENLVLSPVDATATRVLAAGEVRVGLRAGGVNFRDVLNVLGMYPGDAGLLGLEGAGVVLEVGADVTGVQPGDRVMGLFSGAFGPVAVTDQRLVAPVPAGWSLAEAAAAPVVFLTAYYALVELAGLRQAASILIHAAAGGVGIAAVQLARHLGAEIFGTASLSKWPVLRELGLPDSHIASSRTIEFEQTFRAATGGAGVDVVLDSLAGEFVDASLRLAAGPGGRFIEMGKADIRDPESVAAEYAGLRYQAFDLLELDPDEIARMLSELTRLFAAGALKPLPVASWDVRRAPEAFRYLSQARNVGKVVLTMPGSASHPGTVLVTGASGALGGLVTRHLAERAQAARLVLVSRRGADAAGVARLAADLAESSVEVEVIAADAANHDQLAAIITRVPESAPLRGVVHAAGVLDDGMISSLTPARVEAVMRAKVDGAWHLHELTRRLDLDLFVLFSSIAGVWGSPGQGAYAAANTFLDALAAQRQSQGLCALSLAWGPWQLANDNPQRVAEGMTGHLTSADWQRMAAQGLQPLTGADGLALFDAARGADGEPSALLIPARLDPTAFRRSGRDVPALISGLVAAVPARTTSTRRNAASAGTGADTVHATTGLAARLAALSTPAEREETVRELILAQAARVLGMAGLASMDSRRSFRELGFDSLTAVELRNRLTEATGLRLPATVVFDYPSPSALVAFILDELGGRIVDAAPAPTAPRSGAPADDDPVVIVGMGCRFPGGVDSADEFWSLLAVGADTVSGFPTDRGPEWDSVYDENPAAVGRSYAREGAFLYGAGEFDAQFFGISPREALAMDPQQRLLLETSWEALEDAGIDPASLHGSATGVFAGLIYHDYATGVALSDEVQGYLSTGGSGGVASGRVSYALGLEGPAVTVDTACSSSLVALHLAVQSLRSGECGLALVGGVTVMATPAIFVDFSRQRGLAVDGRCKAFAEAADGTGWGEGVGVLVVERLSDARRNGHQVLAVVRGTAVNQDGASNGLTAPNGPSQQRVIRSALAAAGLSAGEVDVIEGHGTGTRLGDPIEAQALLATYGRDRDAASPVLLGSVKSNIGHTQAAAGVAGVIKMVRAMSHGMVPATLHVDEPSSHVDWQAGSVRLVTEATAWPQTTRPRRAGVSSFGFSGTNAHVILEQAPETPEVPADADARPLPVVPWLISARDGESLAAQAGRLREFILDRPALDPADVAWSLASTRSALSRRAAVVGADREELLAGLKQLDVTGSAGSLGKLGFVFTGQGAQRLGMGRQLYAAYPRFADVFDAVCAGLEEHLDHSVSAVIDGAECLDDTVWAQAGLFAVEVALFRLLESWGVAPAVVAGHSIGELAAAHVAGVWSLSDACAVVAARGRLMQALPSGGAMLSIQAGEDDVRRVLAGFEGVDIAAVNGPTAVVVSGPEKSVAAVGEAFIGNDVRVRNLRVSHAFHSSLMEPMLAEFAKVTASVSYSTPRIPIVSTLTGRQVTDELLDPEYWVRQVREPVRFADAVTTLRETGVRTFIELGPDAILTALGATTDDALDEAWLPALRRDRDEPATLVSALATLHTRGGTVDWTSFYAGAGVRRVDLPTYAFTRERFWLLGNNAGLADAAGLGQTVVSGHPLLGAAVELPDTGGLVMTGRLSLSAQPWLAGYLTAGRIIVPETALVEMAVRAGDEAGCAHLSELAVHVPVVLPSSGALQIQVVLTPTDNDDDHNDRRRELAVYARPETEAPHGPWTRHATGVLTSSSAATAEPDAPADEWPPVGAQPQPESTYRYVQAVWRRGEELFAEVALDDEHEVTTVDAVTGFGLHPAILDAILPLTGPAESDANVMLASAWTDVVVHATGAATVRAHLTPVPGAEATTSITLYDTTGRPVASVGSVTRRPLSPEELPAETETLDSLDSLFELEWIPAPTDANAHPAPEQPALVGPGFEDIGSGWRPGVQRHAAMSDLAAALGGVGNPVVPDTIVVTGTRPSADPSDGIAGAARASVLATLALLQEWLASPKLAGTARLVVLTHRAVDAGSVPVDVVGAGVWGLIRVAQSEYPDRIVLLDMDAPGSFNQGLLSAAMTSGEAQIAVRAGRLLIPRLVVSSSAPAAVSAEAATPDTSNDGDRRGTVLITGASGALGALVARRLVAAGRADRIELLSRRGALAPGLGTLAADLAGLGITVHVTACDAADRVSLTSVIAAIPAEAPLRGVIHAAGMLDDGIIETLTPARVEAVMRPKVDGAWNLHELTKQLDLDDFVLFSSMAGIWGNAGQGNYAAANSFLDALAAHRRQAGLSAVSLAWGPWRIDTTDVADAPGASAGGGMAGHIEDADWQRMARHGLKPLGSADGLTRLDAVIERNRREPGTVPALLVPVHLDRGTLRRHSGAGLPPILSGLVGTGTSSAPRRPARRVVDQAGAPQETSGLAARLATLAPAARDREVQDLVRAESAKVLGLRSRDAVDAGRSFLELGLTSVTALELRNRLSAAAGLTLPASVIFDHPTPTALAAYLCANVAPAETALPVLDGLDRLADLLSAVNQDSDKRPEIITRLEGLVADFRSRTADNAKAQRQLSMASDDEMFDLIDRELGI